MLECLGALATMTAAQTSLFKRLRFFFFFKLGRDYSDWRKIPHVGEFPWNRILGGPPPSLREGERELCSLVLRPPENVA